MTTAFRSRLLIMQFMLPMDIVEPVTLSCRQHPRVPFVENISVWQNIAQTENRIGSLNFMNRVATYTEP